MRCLFSFRALFVLPETELDDNTSCYDINTSFRLFLASLIPAHFFIRLILVNILLLKFIYAGR